MIGSLCLLINCKSSKNTSTNTEKKMSYYTDIKPIMLENCAISGCHNSATHKKNLDFSKMEDVIKMGMSGKLVSVVNHEKGLEPMPYKKPKLPKETIQKIDKWVKNGMVQ